MLWTSVAAVRRLAADMPLPSCSMRTAATSPIRPRRLFVRPANRCCNPALLPLAGIMRRSAHGTAKARMHRRPAIGRAAAGPLLKIRRIVRRQKSRQMYCIFIAAHIITDKACSQEPRGALSLILFPTEKTSISSDF